MHALDASGDCGSPAADHGLTPDITEADEGLFAAITSTELDAALDGPWGWWTER